MSHHALESRKPFHSYCTIQSLGVKLNSKISYDRARNAIQVYASDWSMANYRTGNATIQAYSGGENHYSFEPSIVEYYEVITTDNKICYDMCTGPKWVIPNNF